MLVPIQSRFFLPLVVSALLILVLAAFYGQMLPKGSFQHGDEFFTLDRTHSFTIRDDWFTVYSENLPTFKKPPLQYWIGAWLLEGGVDKELALRLPSFVFAIAILMMTGLLALMLLPGSPWVIPAAILLIASSERFWESAVSPLLDAGATLFATVALVATFSAVRQPRWWYVVAFACGVGALQKAPIPVVISLAVIAGIALTRAHHDLLLGRSLRSKHFLIASAIGLALILAWPTLQWLRYGSEAFQQAYLSQIVDRFSPFGEEWGKRRAFDSLLLAGEPILRLFAIAAVFWLPWRLRRLELVGLPAMLAIYAIVVAGSAGIVSPRYSLVFMPMLMASLATMILTVVPGWRWRSASVGLLCLASLGPFKPAGMLGILQDGQTKFVPLLEHVGEAIRPDETLIVCGRGKGDPRIYRGAISYYASAGRPFYRIKSPEDLLQLQDLGTIHPPYRSFCGAGKFEALRPVLKEVVVVETVGEFVHWTASGASGQH